MGVFTLFSRDSDPSPPRGNPVPHRYTVVHAEEVREHLVAEIHYPDATSYEGKKVLVWLNKDREWLRKQTIIDPHFSTRTSSPFARFAPTTRGWRAAVLLLRQLDV